VRVYPGRNRIGLSWILIDPNVVSTKIYWNNRSDSIEVAVEPAPGIDSMDVVFPNMAEGAYLFECFTYDNEGNQSVKVEASGHVYGDLYVNSLLPKPIEQTVYGVDTTQIYWGSGEEEMVGTEVVYTKKGGTLSHLFVPAADALTKLPELEGTDFQYRTLFLPDTMAIDTFYTEYITVSLIDPDKNLVATDQDTYWQASEPDRSDFKTWTTIDLGVRSWINKVYLFWREVKHWTSIGRICPAYT